jgi:hypothetical protein
MTSKEVWALKQKRDDAASACYDGRGVAVPSALDHYIALTEQIHAAEQTLGGKVFLVPVRNLDYLSKEIERINKRAAKLEVAPITLTETEREVVEYERRDDDGELVTAYYEQVYVILTGETPRVAGFEFVATLEHDDAGTIIRRVPTFEGEEFDLTPYRDAKPEHCDHCGLDRRRKDTYIVRNAESGETKQVGRQCLKDFIGAHNPEKYARIAEYLRDFFEALEGGYGGDFGGGGGSGPSLYSILDVLAITSKTIREYGWVAKSKAQPGQSPTADWVDRYLTSRTKDNDLKRCTPEPEDDEKAKLVLDWARSDEFVEKAGTNDYLWNLGVSCASDYIPLRRLGLVCSAVSSYDREREFTIRRDREQTERKDKTFVGTKDKREVFELTLLRIIWIEDRYQGGSKPLYIFNDADGNEVKWFASNSAGVAEQVQIDGIEDPQYHFEPITEGQTYRVKATVKRHEDSDRYGKQTFITRAKIEARIPKEVTV